MSAPDPATPRVLFVGGLGRSGSTLLELLLAQSADVCAVGEVVHLWERALGADERCGCGERFTACPFWRQVGDQAFGGWAAVDRDDVLALKDRVDRTRHIPRLAKEALPPEQLADVRRYADLYTRIYRAALSVTGARVVVDSSKHASLAFALRWAEGLDLRVLHLVRDSRAVAYSWGKQVRRPEVVDGEDFMPTFSPFEVSKLWTAQNAAFHLLASRAKVLRLRYEDFTADPAGTIGALLRLVGVDPAANPVRDRTVELRGNHTVTGNPDRFRTGPTVIRDRDDGWRRTLTGRQRLAVAALDRKSVV